MDSAKNSSSILEKVSIVVVTRNRPEAFFKCMIACKNDLEGGAELVVVDDCSNPQYTSTLGSNARLLRNERRLFLSASRNAGARASSRPYVLFVDDDNILSKDAAKLLAETLQSHPFLAVASPLILGKDGLVWYAGGFMSLSTSLARFAFKAKPEGSVPRAIFGTKLFHSCFMVKRQALLEMNGFDYVHFPMYLSEVDFSERMKRRGYEAVVNTSAEVTHLVSSERNGGILRSSHITEPARAYFVGRNRILLERAYASSGRFLFFLLLFEPSIALFHAISIVASGRGNHGWMDLLRAYMNGLLDGVAGRVERSVDRRVDS